VSARARLALLVALGTVGGCARAPLDPGSPAAPPPSPAIATTSVPARPPAEVVADATPGPGSLLSVPTLARPRPLGVGGTDATEVGAPVELEIPAIGVRSELEDLHLLADGSIAPPVDYAKAGWFADGVRPGAPGPAIIAGHIDSKKRGAEVFYRLHELQPDDLVVVHQADGAAVTFRVTNVEQYPKDEFPVDVVYGPTPAPALRLVTCGGQFDRNADHYRANTVVFAVLAA
jgi:hypothetical protein